MYHGQSPEHLYLFLIKNFLGKSDLRSKLELFWVIKNRDKISRSGWYFMERTLDSKRKPLFKLSNPGMKKVKSLIHKRYDDNPIKYILVQQAFFCNLDS